MITSIKIKIFRISLNEKQQVQFLLFTKPIMAYNFVRGIATLQQTGKKGARIKKKNKKKNYHLR